MDEGRGGLLSAGGILSIIVGAFEVIIGGLLAVLIGVMEIIEPLWSQAYSYFADAIGIGATPTMVIIIGAILAVLGIIAIVGGISAIKRKSFGLSLAGAICALLPLNILGILAVIFVSLAKGQFEVEY